MRIAHIPLENQEDKIVINTIAVTKCDKGECPYYHDVYSEKDEEIISVCTHTHTRIKVTKEKFPINCKLEKLIDPNTIYINGYQEEDFN